MQRSYIVKATLCIEENQFYLRAGDVLMFDSASSRLTVYRNASIVKVIKQSPLSIAALVKSNILEEVRNTEAPVVSSPTKELFSSTKSPEAPKPLKTKEVSQAKIVSTSPL